MTTTQPPATQPPAPAFTSAPAHPDAIVEGPGFRITVLTSRLLRLERHDDNAFVDQATQLVQNRRFDVPDFVVEQTDHSLDLWTDHLRLHYDKGPFSPSGLTVTMRQRAQDAHLTTWRYGDSPYSHDGRGDNLGGTARTLDDADASVALEPGLLSRSGFAVVDDSASLLLAADGWVGPRSRGGEDLYFFGYGQDHHAALRDWFALTGPSPLLPRWALGNWWSRYHRYSDEEYLGLMDRFASAGVPFSVAVLDMDWHLVDIDPTLGSGWTGYTWNHELFRNPQAFLSSLRERGLRVSLNVHPADGIRRHEDGYVAMAAELGVDPDSGLEIAFDATSRAFMDAYFRHLHHPHEDIGVDFWWLDWQSGSHSRVAGLDPLWMLNHLHYRDSGRDGRRALTFSRYAGLGSHRYPIGFSGDVVTTWSSLDFQPYFTATAANVGYHWWSHDIGGHFGGVKDDQLATRWYQFGAFSPINRLHSSASPFNSKEPWRFGPEAERIMTRYLRLRHQLVPYLYTAMWNAHTEGTAPIRPMYHDHPTAPEAYDVPNQYRFGRDLLVAPITMPVDAQTRHAAVTAWLPTGTWFDVFDGRRYDGGRVLQLHRTLEQIPVLAPAGSVLPLAGDPMADVGTAPEQLLVKVFAGDDGAYTLIEDDGCADPSPHSLHRIEFRFTWSPRDDGFGGADAALSVACHAPADATTLRHLVVELVGVQGDNVTTTTTTDLGWVDLRDGVLLEWHGLRLRRNDVRAQIFAVLDDAQIAHDLKDNVMATVERLDGTALLAALRTMHLPGNLYDVLTELVAATS